MGNAQLFGQHADGTVFVKEAGFDPNKKRIPIPRKRTILRYKRYKIVSCSALTMGNDQVKPWYEDKVGDVIMAREVDWPSGYVEAKNGNSVLKCDVELVAKAK